MTIDLKGILGGFDRSGLDLSALASDGKVLSISKLGDTRFTPERPLLVGPVIQDRESLRGLTRTSDHRVEGKTSSGAPFSGSGKVSLRVLSHDTTYQNQFMAEPVKNVIHWEMKTEGFEGVPLVNALSFKHFELVYSTSPLMVQQVTVMGTLGALIEGMDTASSLLGDLEITILAKSVINEKA